MKKTVIAILSVVLVLSLSMVALVACNKDEETKASNTEVLGTAVAVAAQSAMGGTYASSSAEDTSANDDFQAGVNLTVGDGAIDIAAGASIKGIGAAMQPVLEKTISQVDQFLGENGIKVEKGTSDKDGYTDKLTISGTYVDEATGESTTYEYALYIGVQGGDGIDGKKDYTFNALVVIPTDSDPIEYEFSGTATYDSSKDTMIFNLGADAQATYANAFAGIKAYATKTGTIVVELNAGAGVTESIVANASVSVEFGKLDENRYGAVVTVNGTATVAGYGVSFNVTANVYANSTESATDFDINGKFEATVAIPESVPVVGGTYKASADLSGKAKYVVEDDNLEVGLTGNVTFTKVEEENK